MDRSTKVDETGGAEKSAPLTRGSGVVPVETWWLPRPPISRYPGGFPRNFETKLYELLGRPQSILHPFGGKAEFGTRMDLNPETNPDVVGDAHELPFDDGSFEVVVLDPPYSNEESETIYGTPPLRRGQYTQEAVRVSSRYVVTYHVRMQPRPPGTQLVRVVVVLLRSGHTARICQVWKKKDTPDHKQERMLFS